MTNTDALDVMRSLFRMEVTDAAQKLFLLLWHLAGGTPGTIERISSCDLAYDFGKTSDAMRKHLKQLEEAGLIVVDRLRGDLVIQVKAPVKGPPSRHFNPRQKIFDFDREIDGENRGRNSRQSGGVTGGESLPKTNHNVRNSVEEAIPDPVLEPIPVHCEKPPSHASMPSKIEEPNALPIGPEDGPEIIAQNIEGNFIDDLAERRARGEKLPGFWDGFLRNRKPAATEEKNPPPRVSRKQEHTYLSNNQESRTSKSNNAQPGIFSETLKNIAKTVEIRTKNSPIGKPPRDPHFGLRKFIQGEARSALPDADPYLVERIAVSIADFGLGKKLLRKWLACGEFKQPASLPAYVHRCLLRELDERGIAIEEVDFKRKVLFGRTPKGAA